jgi:hypothetical protein
MMEEKSLNSEELEKELNLIMENKPVIDIILSDEQEKIVKSKSNIIVDAVAGSGKTTTVLHIALANPDKNIFQITYNNMLKREVRKKVNRLSIDNMEIHTYHSLAVKYYKESAYTDEEIKKLLYYNYEIKNCSKVDILIIDETQDMILDYYNLIKKFIKDTNSSPRLVIIGDRYQGIYDFKGADTKFLTLADQIWNTEFKRLNLTTSFRLTNEISWFVNTIMLKYNRINTKKTGPTIDYYIANPYEIYKKIGKKILKMFLKDKITPNDIFILIPSVKSTESPYKKLENYLVKHGIKCITPTSDDAKLDDKIINNKVVFTTYHQSKGRERKVVILYNFDDSFTQYYTRNKSNEIEDELEDFRVCPNILYVGATRASYKLILIQDNRHKPLHFLNLKELKNSPNLQIHIINKQDTITKTLSPDSNSKKTSVTDLIKFITPEAIESIMSLEKNLFIKIKDASKLLEIPNKIETENNLFEDVSDLNGLVIPAIYEKKILNKNSTIEGFVLERMNDITFDLKKHIGKINIPCEKISDYLKIGNVYLALQNKLHAKIAQIKKYKWITSKMMEQCHKNITDLTDLTSDVMFEVDLVSDELVNEFIYNHKELGEIHIRGRLDALDKDKIWEFKCVDYISFEHKLQLIVYAWIYNNSIMLDKYGKKDFYLLNIKSGETLQLNYDNYKIESIIEIILQDKYVKKRELDDKEFVKLCNKIEN